MNVLPLPGLGADPIQSYLVALGLLRGVAEQADRSAALAYHPGGFRLHSELDLDALVGFYAEQWAPTPVVSPWNKGSGLRPDGSAASATAALERLRAGSDPRLAPLRDAVAAAERVVASFPEDINLEKEKAELLRRCRAELPDAALDWFDASVVLLSGDPVYPRLLGTGGNLGRMDLSANLYERLDDVVGLAEPSDRERSRGWLFDLLTGRGTTGRVRATPGQFEPGAVGGVNSVSDDRDTALVNPWGFVLALEGALLFASLPARRMGAARGTAAMPFTVRSDPAGGAGLAEGENRFAELWLPLWRQPATLGQLRRLFGEGRLAWGRGTASSAVDAARAIASFGTERGIEAFQRYAVMERLGQSPLVVPVERYATPRRRRPAVEATRALDVWVGRLRRIERRPAALDAALRRYGTALLRLSAEDRGAVLATLASLAELDTLVGRNRGLRADLPPLPYLAADVWLPELLRDLDPGVEVELAIAAASAWDRRVPGTRREDLGTWPRGVAVALRGLSSNSLDPGARPTWSSRADAGHQPGDPVRALAAIHARHAAGVRGITEPERTEQSSIAGQLGTVTTYQHGRWTSFAALDALVSMRADEGLFDRLLRCMCLFDPRSHWPTATSGPTAAPATAPDQSTIALRWLAVQQGRDVFEVPLLRDAGGRQVRLRPSADWPTLLLRGRVDRVLADAHRRLRVAGLPVIAPPAAPQPQAGRRIAAALLLPLSGVDAAALLRGVLDHTRIDHRRVRLQRGAETPTTGETHATA